MVEVSTGWGPYKGEVGACDRLVEGITLNHVWSVTLPKVATGHGAPPLRPRTRSAGVSRARQCQDMRGPLHQPTDRLAIAKAQLVGRGTSPWRSR
jgi:hypothetical protein